MSKRITILVGTMTGTAEIVAEDVRDSLKALGWDVELVMMDDLDGQVFEREGYFLVCSSTYGQGDVPDNAMKLYDDLGRSRPDLSGKRYGVIALGDSAYVETFTNGGLRFDRILSELGAARVGAVCQHDASSDEVPEEKGVAWAREWVKLLDSGARAADDRSDRPANPEVR